MIDKLLVSSTADLRQALRVIDQNHIGLAFAVDDQGRLAGVITDGDIRRGMLRGETLDSPVSRVMTADCMCLPVSSSRETIAETFSDAITVIPLIDEDMRPVDFASLRRLHQIPVAEPDLSGNEIRYVVECLRDTWISSQGPYVRRFETDFARFVNAPHALATSSGTTALHLALAALDIGPGDEVIVPDLTFAASINAILYTGATPVIVDVEPDTWNLDPKGVEQAITPNTKAVMIVHLYGMPAQIDEIEAITRPRGIYIVEDAAEALGATYKGRHVGTFGDMTAFSFFGNKLITTGEGGMLVARDAELAHKAKVLRDHGMDPKRRYWHESVGFNYRMTNIQAAIGVAQMERVGNFIARKLAIAKRYRANLAGTKGLRLPVESSEAGNVYWLFSLIVEYETLGIDRDELMQGLSRGGIETRPLFHPLHRMPPYRQYGQGRRFPVAEWLADNGMSFPSSVSITDAEIDYICSFLGHVLDVRRFALAQKATS